MFLVGAAAYQAVGLNDSALLERLEDAHSGLVKGADASSALDWTKLLEGLAVFVGGIAGGPVGAAAAKGVALASHALSGKVTLPGRGRTLSPDDTRIRVLCDVLNEVTERARQATGKQLLVLVDGLDKEVDPARIRELFGSGVLASPAVGGLDLVAACPISAMFEVEHTDLRGFTAERLDLFDVLSLDEERRRDALTRMFDVLERRIRYAGLTPERVLPGGGRIGEVEARVLGMTGGVLRDLMLVVRRAIVHAVMEERDPEQDGLSAQDLDAGIRGQREDYLRRVDLDDEELLRRTWLEGNRPGGNRAKLLFNRNIILAYRNGSEPWYRPHPMVVGRLRRRFSELPDDSYR